MIKTPARALVVTPHPDDAEFGCAGTVARWVREGCEVAYVLCTDGGKGTANPEVTPQALAETREREQRAACAVLGVKEVVCLGYPDGELEESRQFLREIVRQIRRFRPEVVFCPEFFRKGSWHRDHRVTGRVVVDACFPYARDYLHFPELWKEEGLAPHKVATVLMWGSEEPDTFLDITDTIEQKVQALLAHASQIEPHWRAGERIREWARGHGEKAGVQYAEAFRRIDFRT